MAVRQPRYLPPPKVDFLEGGAGGQGQKPDRRQPVRFPHVDGDYFFVVLGNRERDVVHVHLAERQVDVFQFEIILQQNHHLLLGVVGMEQIEALEAPQTGQRISRHISK